MRSSFHSRYGPPEVLSIRETAQPVPKDNEILVKVHAATVNRTDCGILHASPFVIRGFTGLTHPRLPATGTDFAGVVEATGRDVTEFKTGDRVWGFNDMGISSHAEYLVVSQNDAVMTIPERITFGQAAAAPEGAHYAINFINKIFPEAGQKALVNGATGSIGSAAVQLLKFHGMHITATCRGQHFDRVRTIGADRVIDYEKEDYTRLDESFDYVFDAVGKNTFFRSRRVLAPKGIYVSSELGPGSQNLWLPLVTKLSPGKKTIFPFPQDRKKSLAFIRDLMEQDRFRPLIDREYPLEEIREAFTYVESGQKVGNVILKMIP